jgi:hypothetical protein
MTMTDGLTIKPQGRVRGLFEKGRSGNPLGRRVGRRNKTTIAAAALLAGEVEALTRKAVELALVGDPTALRLCIERVLPQCRERAKFALPPIETGDYSRRLHRVETGCSNHPGAAGGMYGTGFDGYYNL